MTIDNDSLTTHTFHKQTWTHKLLRDHAWLIQFIPMLNLTCYTILRKKHTIV